ncbi:MAG: efflux RND transporter periplasmic adaptor subunit [Pseudomonadota bacterium]
MFVFLVCRPSRVLICGLLVLLALTGCEREAPQPTPSESFEEALTDSIDEHTRKHLDPKYVCPMHPQIVKGEPGNCPICGMELVAKMVEAADDGRPAIEVSHAVVQNMGIRTDRVKRDTLWKYIQTVGRVDYDETRLVHVHPRTEGWLERLNLRAEGDPVKRGELLGQLYSPEILSAQVDFLIALDQKGSKRNLENARNRLRLLGVTEGTINRIQKNRKSQNTVPVYAPAKGIMAQLQAREGMYVKPEMEIFTIVDPSVMWVLVDVFEYQIDWLQEGLSTEMKVPAYPGRSWEGKVDYIYPDLDPRARTLRVRLAFDNSDGKLKANMFAKVVIYGGPKHNVLLIPADALIETGERSTVVKALGDGHFQPVDVVTGATRAGRVEILSGLDEGDEVVISGQFLIDSESSLQASFLRMEE